MTTEFLRELPGGNPANKPRYQPLLLAVSVFAGGIVFDRLFDGAFIEYLLAFFAALLVWLVLAGAGRTVSSKTKTNGLTFSLSCLLLIALFWLGAAWQHARWNWFGKHEVGQFAAAQSQLCCLRATLLREPRTTVFADHDPDLDPLWSAERTRLIVRVEGIRDRQNWLPASGFMDVIVHADLLDVQSGDQLQLTGKLVATRPPTNPGQFDFQDFSRKRGMFAVLHVYYPQAVEARQRASGWTGDRLLSMLRQRLNDIAWQYIDAGEAGFASAILLGNREQISDQRRTTFLETGTAHLLAISGLHVGILAGSIFLLCRIGMMGRHSCLLATIAFVLFYMWLVEFRPPVTRAAILVTLFCLGRRRGQRGYSFNLLAASGWIVLLINPSELFSVGAQLSFLAVATLSFTKQWIWWPVDPDPLKQLIAETRPPWLRSLQQAGTHLRTAFLGSGMIWLIGSPLVAFHFHLVAPMGLLLNPLLLLPIAIGLYGGLATLVLGWLPGPVAQMPGWLCQESLGLIDAAIGWGQAVPGSHFWTAGPQPLALAGFYLGVLLLVVFPITRVAGRWALVMGMLWVVLGWMLPERWANDRFARPANELTCTFVDVGHGTSVLLQFPDGRNLLYDCGSFGSRRHGLQSVSSVLWSQQVAHLDAVIVSHADVDHFNALPDLSQRFSIGRVYLSPQMLGSDAPAVAKLIERLRRRAIDVASVAAGDRWVAGSNDLQTTRIEILSPTGNNHGSSDNADSIVLLVTHAGQRILLPGDLEAEGLQRLLRLPPLHCDVLMAAHHGSRNSMPAQFSRWASPSVVVISGGRSRVDAGVVEDFQRHSQHVFRTDRDGAVRLILGGSALRAYIFPAGQWQAVTLGKD